MKLWISRDAPRARLRVSSTTSRGRSLTSVAVAIPILLAIGMRIAHGDEQLIILVDKNCGDCREGEYFKYSGRRPGTARLAVLTRRNGRLVVVKQWRALYGHKEGPKETENDHQTPEGLYRTTLIFPHPGEARFGGVSIGINYPNEEDAIRNPRPGKHISIHGGIATATDGCIRILDPDRKGGVHTKAIAELAEIVGRRAGGVPVLIARQVADECMPAVERPVGASCSAVLAQLTSSSRSSRTAVLARLANPTMFSSPTVLTNSIGSAVTPGPTSAPRSTTIQKKVRPVSVTAGSSSRTCQDPEQTVRVDCSAGRAADHDEKTAWCQARGGTGIGEWITFQFGRPYRIQEIDIKNGYWKNGPDDGLWRRNGRVAEFEVIAGNRKERFSTEENHRTRFTVSPGIVADAITLRVARVTRGSRWPDVCVSDVTFRGIDP